MTSVGILSDTHGYFDDQLHQVFADCTEVWHAGDAGRGVLEKLQQHWKVTAVAGNIDGLSVRQQFKEECVYYCEAVKIFMIHIGGYPGRYEPRVKEKLVEHKPQIFISGHSHILKIARDASLQNLLYINPGAAGRSGFQIMRTCIKLKIEKEKIFDVHVIELGKRNE
jgi:hypothetical protein